MARIGIGPALRTARLTQGKSIEEASRETRIRGDYLRALERETFDALLGGVYVRGCLRSYSTYLGLDADKVLVVYNRHFGEPEPMTPEPPPAPDRVRRRSLAPAFAVRHPRASVLVATVLAFVTVFGVAGALSRPEPPPRAPPVLPPAAASESVTVGIRAEARVDATVRLDGEPPERFRLRPGEVRAFVAAERIGVTLSRGGLAEIVLNGRSLGVPGDPSAPFTATYGRPDPGDGRSVGTR